MPVYKEKSGTWRVNYRFTDWTGANKQTTKHGFATRREAVAWEKEQSIKLKASLNMTFGSFVDLYTADMKCRVRENTWQSKDHIIRTKILPYFKDRKIGDINSRDVVTWQNELLSLTMDNGEHYSQNYLKTVHNQLSAIFNHAVKCYGLPKNPAALAGNMGKEEKKEMQFWTQEEYRKFADAIMNKPMSFMIPWALITEPMFHGLSMESKVLYAMMLDRMGLSKKNNWLDEQKRVFIYYTVDEIIEKMGCCKQKTVKLLKELKEIGLIECERIGLTKPNRIYVKTYY